MAKIRLPYPHRGQRIVRQQARRWNFLAAGRRWRKTTLLMSLGIEAAMAGKSVVWGSPTYAQVQIPWQEMQKAIPKGYAEYNEQRRDIFFPQGGKMHFRSLDKPDSARGLTADLVLVDEAGYISPVAWYEVLLPMLLDTGGDAWVAGTPNKRNWFFTESVKARSREDGIAWNIPTLGVELVNDGTAIVRRPHPLENPDITFEDVQQLFEAMTAQTFRQEILAQFLENAGSVFSFLERSVVLQPYWTCPEEHKDHVLVAGVDWGRHKDYTAISIGCATCHKEVDLVRYLGVEYSLQRERLAQLCQDWNIDIVVVEQNSIGDVQFEELIYADLPVYPFKTTAQSKPPMIERLAFSIEKATWEFIDHPAGTGELLAYERQVNPVTGYTRYSGPEEGNDDTVIARGLMLDAAIGAGPLL